MKIPKHVAIILDGNGRWAKSKGMPRNYGHTIGTKNVENTNTIYKRIEDLEAKKHTVSNAVAEAGKYVSGVHVNENGELAIDRGELAATNIKATAINAGDATVAVEGTNVSA